MAFQCLACPRTFHDRRALKTHQRSCKDYQNIQGITFQQKRAREEEEDPESLLRKRKQVSIDPEGHTAEADIPESVLIPQASSSEPTPLPVPPITRSARSGRGIRFPKRFDDFLPGSATPLSHIPSKQRPLHTQPDPESVPTPSAPPEPVPAPAPAPVPAPDPVFDTTPNEFGLFRRYKRRPTHDPDPENSLDKVCDSAAFPKADPASRQDAAPAEPWYAPFTNAVAAIMMCWQYTKSATKSASEMDRLAHSLGDSMRDGFSIKDFTKFNTARENARIDSYIADSSSPFNEGEGWHQSSVKIRLPADKVKTPEDQAPEFEVRGVWHRNIVDIIKTVYSDSTTFSTLHTTPFQQFWKPLKDSKPERVHPEIYCSDSMLDADEEIQKLPREPDDMLERIVAPLMLWSDATHLANFGTASLWPFYLFFGSQSKYTRAKPTAYACHHLAYIPTLPDIIQDFYRSFFGKSATADTLTHCKRELIHAIWNLLLDNTFMEAYTHGIVIRCGDGVTRRVFPRFFTYSADYPEKVILASIKYLAKCPCPRCLVEKKNIVNMGMKSDMKTRERDREDDVQRRQSVETARRLIHDFGVPLKADRLKTVLGEGSLVPTRNAFSSKLARFGFNFYSMFVVDLLHEFELGVWKATFTHLMRVLEAAADDAIQKLNERYRAVPTFGRSTIRRFHKNASAMRKLAARDFEDLLQCAIPVFEGLLPARHDAIVANLLFDLATWHAYAKLRLHTGTTLGFFATATCILGATMRRFVKKTCAAYDTRELPHEMAARGRRKAALIKKGLESGKNMSGAKFGSEKLQKVFNLVTYKYHALGDYVRTILRFGTTDSISTQVGELAHKVVKRHYDRTNKNNFIPQLTRHDARERLLRKVAKRSDEHRRREQARARRQKRKRPERLPLSNPSVHYHIAVSTRKHLNVRSWTHDHPGDPALKGFLPRLKDHLLARTLGLAYDGDERVFSDEDRDNITIINDRLYQHSVVRINYTSYDMRRQQDSINPRTQADVMVLSQEDGTPDNPVHPYWYARVVGVFHCMVHHRGQSSEPKRMDFLWVRWFGLDTDTPGGWDRKRLHSVAFIPEDDPAAFGFLDPEQIIRGIHLIPAFTRGHTSERLGLSIARQPTENDEDWEGYYINMFVDRDMFMRFRGGGVGHKGTWHLNASLLRDGQALQVPEEPSEEVVDEQGGAEDDDSEEESEEEAEEEEEGPLTEEEEEDSDDDPDPLPEDDGRERDERVLAEEGYGEF